MYVMFAVSNHELGAPLTSWDRFIMPYLELLERSIRTDNIAVEEWDQRRCHGRFCNQFVRADGYELLHTLGYRSVFETELFHNNAISHLSDWERERFEHNWRSRHRDCTLEKWLL